MAKLTSDVIKARAKQHGADIVGVASAERLASEPPGHRPADLLPGAKTVISVGIRQLRSYLEKAPNTTFFMYGYRQKNDYINEIVSDIAQFLDGEGYFALPVAPWGAADLTVRQNGGRGKKPTAQMRGVFSHSRAAAGAGLGEVGLNGMFLSAVYGPRIHLGSVITTAPLTADGPAKGKLCDRTGCMECVKQCPAEAIAGDGTLDPVSCIIALDKLSTGYDETKKQMLDRQDKEDPLRRAASAVGYSDYSGIGFCGLACINACPVGRKELK
jgi:epoxyqueuosine reductase QueG